MLLVLRLLLPLNFFLYIFIFRWVKFEEDVEEGGNRWSKPHVATLSLHSLFELRSFLLNGTGKSCVHPVPSSSLWTEIFYFLLNGTGIFSNNPWTEEFTTGHHPLFSTSMGFFLTHARSPIPVGSYFSELNLNNLFLIFLQNKKLE